MRQIQTVSIAEGVTSVGAYAFYEAYNLAKVYIPLSVTTMEDQAFSDCRLLGEVIYFGSPSQWKAITKNASGPWNAVLKCSKAGANLTYQFDKESGVLTISGTGAMDDFDNTTIVPWEAYQDMMESVVVEEGVTSIGRGAFSRHSALKTVQVPASVSDIDLGAFNECNSLQSITVVAGNSTYLSENGILFNKDKTVLLKYPAEKTGGVYSIPNTVSEIATAAFAKCSQLGNVRFPNGLKTIGNLAFLNCSGLTSITIPDSVTQIGATAFSSCTGLRQVTIGSGITDLDSCAFENCTSLEDVQLPDTLINIRENTFADCTSLKRIVLPSGMNCISDAAFYGCSALEELVIGGVKEIWRPFENCTTLKKVVFQSDAPDYCTNAFQTLTLTAYYPAGNATWTASKQAEFGGNVTWIAMAYSGICGDNLEWVFDAGTLTISGTGDMYDYSQDQTNPAPWTSFGGDIKKLVLEEGVTGIGDYAFADCSVIENASFPSTLTRVGEYPFYRFSRPNGNVYYRVFWSEVNQTVRQWSQIRFEADSERFLGGDSTNFIEHAPIIASGKYGDRVYWELNENGTMEFFGSGDMDEFWATGSWLYDESAKTIIISEGITNIGMNAFETYGQDPLCVSLETVSVASSVKRVEEMAFAGCQALKTITFTGDAPTFGTTCFRDVTATAYYPAGNATWTTAVMQNYEGNITWLPYCLEHVFGEWITEGNTSRRTCTLCDYTEHKVTTDSGDVEIEIPEQPDLKVEVDPVQPSEDNYILVEEALNNAGDQEQAILKVFDINLKNSEGAHVQPSGTVKVKLPLDWSKDGKYKVYRVNDDGTLTDMNAYRQDSHMVFETDHFSLYVIVGENTEKRLNLVGSDLAKESIIWIDGIAYPALTADNGSTYVELPENVPPVLVTYSYNNSSDDRHTQYPTGMKVYRISETDGRYTVERIPELDNLLQYSGSSIRITGNKGIRMITSVNQDTRNKLTGNGLAGFKLLEYGTLLAQTSKLGNNPLVLDGANVKSNYAYKKGVADPVFKYTNGLIQYTNVLVGFTDEQCKEDIAMRPYMKLLDENGEEFVIYGGIVYRSIGYIAYQNRSAFQPGSAAYEYVWSIIRNVYGTQYDSEYRK